MICSACTSNSYNKQQKTETFDLTGLWAQSDTANAIFSIDGDTLNYVDEEDGVCIYTIIDGFFVINCDSFITKNKILKINSDTLIFKTETGVINTFFKRK